MREPAARARRGARWAVAPLLAAVALSVLSACATRPVPVFRPSGPPPQRAVAAAAPPPAPQAVPTAGPRGGGDTFPAGFSVRFRADRAGGAARQAMIAGYENYVRAFWAGILSHGSDTRYQRYLAGNALTFAERQIRYYTLHHLTIRGIAIYSGINVTDVYFGRGAVVSACVDVAGLSAAGPAPGARGRPIYSKAYLHYLEQVAEGRFPDGTWYVTHTDSYPATTRQGAACQ